MKKGILIFFLVIVIVGIIIYIFNSKRNSNKDYIAQRVSTERNDKNLDLEENSNNNENKKEEELSLFSTRLIKDTKARESNINLACNTLNGTIVKSGETFSFWEVIGNPTKEKGYKKAKTFTSDGKIRKAYGGGLCQVSTTIYNAVLKARGQEAVERHEHSRDVAYIEDGKDASVAYSSSDFKFRNNLEDDVKIEAKLEENQVKIRLLRIY